MKSLILVRHAKSDWSNPQLKDFDRPLNKRGIKNAPLMAKKLKTLLNENPNLIISSPSLRTKQTLEYFLKEFDYKGEIVFEDKIYETSYLELLEVIKNVDDTKNKIFVIGHNPALNDLLDVFIDDFNLNIPTSAILKLDFDTSSWKSISKNNAKLIFFQYPKMFS